MSSSVVQPAFMAGLVIGVLSGLPVVNVGNCCCCLWVVSGGALAAYLLQQNTARAITVADGMFVGLIAGVIGAVIGAPISWVASGLMGSMFDQAAFIDQILQNAGNIPPEMRDALERAKSGAFATGMGAATAVVGLLISLVVNAIFATIGGLIGALLFKKEPPVEFVTPPPVPPNY